MANKVNFAFDRNMYNPQKLQRMNEQELRKEYSRLRSIANKRVDRLMGSEFRNTETARMYGGGFVKLDEIASKKELAYELADVAGFLSRKSSSISGIKEIRRDTIQTLNARGYDFVNKENFLDFVHFMEEVRARMGAIKFDSKRIANFFEESEAKEHKSENIDELANQFMRSLTT